MTQPFVVDAAPPVGPSRRRFLNTTSAATAGAAVAPFVAAGAQAAPAALAATAPLDKAQDLAHETSVDAGQALSSNQGAKISDNQNSLKAGVRGPVLIEDHLLREKNTAFDHERIPERVVNARGAAAHGVFQACEPMGSLKPDQGAFPE